MEEVEKCEQVATHRMEKKRTGMLCMEIGDAGPVENVSTDEMI
jgi:hypothetical protein